MDNDELKGNPRLRDYLQSAGTLIPSDASLMVEWGNSKEGAKVVRHYGCVFCLKNDPSIDIATTNACWAYKWTSKTVLRANDVTKTDYKMCWDCYQDVRALSEFRSRLRDTKFYGAVIEFHNGVFMTSRLKNYLDSNGLILPSDWTEYTDRGRYKETCLFCRGVPADYPVKRHYQSITTETKARCCDDCFTSVKEMEESRSEDSLFGESGNESKVRIQKYVYEGKFLDGIEDHYQHLPIYPDDSPTYKSGHFVENCYFCSRYADSAYVLYHSPVTTSDRFSGGTFRCCDDCDAAIKRLRLTDPHSLSDSIYVNQICETCGGDYLITKGESIIRQQYSTIGMHMCPACTYARAYEMGDEVFRPEEDLRYKEYTCTICKGSFYIDLTMSRNSIKTKFMNKSTDFCCDICAYSGSFAIFAVNYKDWTIRFHAIKQAAYRACFYRPGTVQPSETVLINHTTPEEALGLAIEHIKTDLT